MGIEARRPPQRETEHNPQWDHGEPCPNEGDVMKAFGNPKLKGYTGCNACWREGHGHEED